jgi:uncharacterized repeat protein (TIGR01451 family)
MKSKETRKMLRNVRRKTALALTPAALLVALAGLVLPVLAVRPGAIRADSGPFDGSSVAPTADEVRVGEAVGFALYLVNSSPVTATDVLVWNPLPPGSTYVSASGGAFPVVGGEVHGGLLAAPPEGQAYDARLHTSALLTDTEEVTGLAWVGDVRPDEMVALGLIVTVNDPAGQFLVDEMSVYDDRELAGQFSGQTWVPPHEMFLTLILSRFEAPTPTPTPVQTPTTTTMTFTIPYGQGLGFGGGSLDPDYGQALAGSNLNFGDGGVYLGQVPPMGPYQPWYAIGRAYGGWDTSALPDEAEILSAVLVLEVACNPPTTTFGTTVYQGAWTPPLGEDAWYTPGNQPVGAWDTADYPCTGHVGSGQVRIDLDPSVVDRVGLTLLEIRSDREGTPPVSPEQVLVNRSPAFPALVVTYGEEP